MLHYYGVSVSHQKMTENLSVIIINVKFLFHFVGVFLWGESIVL